MMVSVFVRSVTIPPSPSATVSIKSEKFVQLKNSSGFISMALFLATCAAIIAFAFVSAYSCEAISPILLTMKGSLG